MSDEETGRPTRYIVWAWYPGGWQLYRVETDWDEAVKAYQEAKADTVGPAYLTEIKRVEPKADWIYIETNYRMPGGSGYCTCRVFQPGSSSTAILCKHCGKPQD